MAVSQRRKQPEVGAASGHDLMTALQMRLLGMQTRCTGAAFSVHIAADHTHLTRRRACGGAHGIGDGGWPRLEQFLRVSVQFWNNTHSDDKT